MFQNGLILLLFASLAACSQVLKSTDFQCVNKIAKLECAPGHVIFISSVYHKYANETVCPDEALQSQESLARAARLSEQRVQANIGDCVGVDQSESDVLRQCNGQQKCFVQVRRKSHITGFYGTNCDFESNYANVFYSCVPNSLRDSVSSFDICERDGPEVILGLQSGFVHSPNYPKYYGNNRNCMINIGVPNEKRLVIYLISLSMEGLSIFDGKPRDFLTVDRDKELYGSAETPYILYNASDREQVQFRFKSDWITSTKLSTPKGFLLHFSLVDDILTTTAAPTTTTTTPTQPPKVPETQRRFASSLKAEDHLSRKQKLDHERNDSAVTIISVLVGLVGVLVLIIFGLLLMFRNKPKEANDDYHIYDTADEKSMANTIYNNISQCGDYTIGGGSSVQSDSLNVDCSDLKRVQGAVNAPVSSTRFNSRLRKLYQSLNQTLSLSAKILNGSGGSSGRINIATGINEKENVLNNTIIKKEMDGDASERGKANEFSVNEFNPNDVDVKFEKDIAIDTLRLCKTMNNSFHSPMSMTRKKLLLNKNREQQSSPSPPPHYGANDDELNRTENIYVSNPIHIREEAASAIKNSTFISETVSNTEQGDDDEKRLQIYEVNFDNNYAYITPASSATKQPQPQPQLKESESKKEEEKENSEIYHTISEMDNNGDGYECPATTEASLYETPTNKRLFIVESHENNEENPNSSVIQLLDENNETHA